jgi:hypothetical protein
MATDQQPADAPAPESVVEFGAEPPARAPRRWSATGFAAAVGADRRVVPLAAVLGGIALFGSLVSEWQITAVDTTAFGGTQPGNRTITAGVAELDGWGGGYLGGLFVLVAATVLVLFGPVAGRRYARLVGMTIGGVLLAMLVAIAQTLKDTSRALELVYTLALNPDQLQLSYGRGIWCAAIGVAAITLALYLAGRYLPAATAPAPAAATGRRGRTPAGRAVRPDRDADQAVHPTR